MPRNEHLFWLLFLYVFGLQGNAMTMERFYAVLPCMIIYFMVVDTVGTFVKEIRIPIESNCHCFSFKANKATVQFGQRPWLKELCINTPFTIYHYCLTCHSGAPWRFQAL